MANRQDKEREQKLQPERINYAVTQITNLGYKITSRDSTKVQFEFKGSTVTFYPYSGWATGKTINDGRGIDNLLNQIKDEKK